MDTARQTADVFGVNWGGGLYFNYVFTAVWIADVWWLWRYGARPSWMTAAIHAFFGFMFFNATIVFGSGFVRWLGVASMLVLAVIAASRLRPKQARSLPQ